ncbi:unnamed protein product [Lupinus luteus]|uniref:Uncharacterized protein n=1 Tax=Lupinus luteus TaxID=3873 RepID=A0AAV1Y7M5_LUPLU
MSLRGDAISQAGANKAVRPPTGLGMRRPFLRKETGERKSYAIDRPFHNREEPERPKKPRTKTKAFRFTPHSLLNKARPRALGRSAGSFPVVLFLPRERRTEKVCPARGGSVESVCCLVVLAFNEAERGKFIVLAQCAPLSSSAPPGSLGCWPTKHLPAAAAARQVGGALVILTVLYAGAPSHCSSHKLWQLQLETTGARPARPEWAQRSAPHSNYVTLWGLSLLPDLERYYESSVPDSIAT